MTLVRKRISPDSKGLYGDTSLHLAAMNGHVEVCSSSRVSTTKKRESHEVDIRVIDRNRNRVRE